MNNDLISRAAMMDQAAIGGGMTMRTIDADAISEDILSLDMTITGLLAGKGVLNEFMKEYRRSVLRIVDDAATVDAVEVVRCKDCKHHYWVQEPCHGKIIHYCNLPHMSGVEVFKEFFCYYGERKEGADNG